MNILNSKEIVRSLKAVLIMSLSFLTVSNASAEKSFTIIAGEEDFNFSLNNQDFDLSSLGMINWKVIDHEEGTPENEITLEGTKKDTFQVFRSVQIPDSSENSLFILLVKEGESFEAKLCDSSILLADPNRTGFYDLLLKLSEKSQTTPHCNSSFKITKPQLEIAMENLAELRDLAEEEQPDLGAFALNATIASGGAFFGLVSAASSALSVISPQYALALWGTALVFGPIAYSQNKRLVETQGWLDDTTLVNYFESSDDFQNEEYYSYRDIGFRILPGTDSAEVYPLMDQLLKSDQYFQNIFSKIEQAKKKKELYRKYMTPKSGY